MMVSMQVRTFKSHEHRSSPGRRSQITVRRLISRRTSPHRSVIPGPLTPVAPIAPMIPIVPAMMIMRQLAGKLSILLDQQLGGALGTDEDRVGVEPDVRIGLNVVGHLLDTVDGRQMRRAGGIRAADAGVVNIDQRIAGAIGDVGSRDRNIGTAGTDVEWRLARSKGRDEAEAGRTVPELLALHLRRVDLLGDLG